MPVADPRSLLARGGRDFVYVASGLPLGIAWLIALVTLLAVGLSLALITIGIPILAFTLLLVRLGANAERERAALALGAPIARPRRLPPASTRLLDRMLAPLRDRRTWRELGYMLLLGPVGIVAGTIAIALWSAALAALAAPVFAPGAADGSTLDDLGAAVYAIAIGGIALAALAALVTHALAAGCAGLAQGLLAPDDRGRARRADQLARGDALGRGRLGRRAAAPDRARPARRRPAPARLHRDGARPRPRQARQRPARRRRAARGRARRVEGRDARAARPRPRHPPVRAVRPRPRRRALRPRRARDDPGRDPRRRRRPAPARRRDRRLLRRRRDAHERRPATPARSQAYVDVHRNGRHLVLEIGDDGHGGARRVPGSGLEGLAQRVEALDGTLTVDSPGGGPTTIVARLPCAS